MYFTFTSTVLSIIFSAVKEMAKRTIRKLNSIIIAHIVSKITLQILNYNNIFFSFLCIFVSLHLIDCQNKKHTLRKQSLCQLTILY